MEETKYYCDACKKEITRKEQNSLGFTTSFLKQDGGCWHRSGDLDLCKTCLPKLEKLIRGFFKGKLKLTKGN